ncbi:MAG: thioesterase [Lachnospiraceae bacterium]|nr:thioesterase [Lachnospiraceae bacterium]
MYSFTSRVRYSETDETGNLSLRNLMNYLQDCCLFQSEALGVGPDDLRKRHRLWLLSGWQVVIDRYPRMFEKITVATIPYEFSGCLGWRNVTVSDENDICIVRANSPWVYVNTDTGRPAQPDETEKSAYGLEERIPMDYAPRKIRLPENMTAGAPVPVIQEFIDTNHHVNNAQYVDIAVNIMEEDMRTSAAPDSPAKSPSESFKASKLFIREVRVEYKKQAILGDILYPKTCLQDGWYYVAFTDSDGHIYAAVAIRL